ncbi:MAG: barstar family protein [Rugosibacter sp.]|nr:barstar family protein [Rugosibacter sp.]
MSVAHYQALFGSASRSGVYHLPQGDQHDLIAGAEAAGCLVQQVDLRGARNRDELLEAIGRSLGFPEWFGHNWDALNDCLLDMGWRPAEGYVVILEHCDGIHARAEGDFVTLMQVIQAVANEWREQDVPFWCLVDMQADGLAWLPTVAQPGQ